LKYKEKVELIFGHSSSLKGVKIPELLHPTKQSDKFHLPWSCYLT